MNAVSDRVSHSEFDLFCITNDIEVGDTLLLQHSAKGKESVNTVLGVYLGEGRNGVVKILLESGKNISLNPDLLKASSRTETFRALGKSVKPLKLKDIQGA